MKEKNEFSTSFFSKRYLFLTVNLMEYIKPVFKEEQEFDYCDTTKL